jgi:hypothetical protein
LRESIETFKTLGGILDPNDKLLEEKRVDIARNFGQILSHLDVEVT